MSSQAVFSHRAVMLYILSERDSTHAVEMSMCLKQIWFYPWVCRNVKCQQLCWRQCQLRSTFGWVKPLPQRKTVGIQQSKHSSYIVSLSFHHTFYHTLCWQWCSSAKEVSILQFHREINDVTGGALTDYFNFMPLWWNLTTKSSRVLCEMHHL